MNGFVKGIVGVFVSGGLLAAGLSFMFAQTAKHHARDLDAKTTAIEIALVDFYTHHGHFPTVDEGLVVLELPDATFTGPRGTPMRYTSTHRSAEMTLPGFPDWKVRVDARPLMAPWIARTRAELDALADEAGAFPVSLSSSDAPLDQLDERDPWGNRYRIDMTNQRPWSLGPDGEAGTDDDIYPTEIVEFRSGQG